jgi:hypothetical protein
LPALALEREKKKERKEKTQEWYFPIIGFIPNWVMDKPFAVV